MVKTYKELYLQLRRDLEKIDDPNPAVNARELLAFSADKTPEEILRDMGLYASEQVAAKLEKVREAYLSGMPMAYILGQWSFFGLPMKVTKDVLIPRDDTMVVAALAMEELKDREKARVLDLCTGSGCIGIAIAHHLPGTRVTLADISESALAIAKENVSCNKLTGRVQVMKVDCREPAPAFLGKYDVIVSNPPYITEQEMRELDDSVKKFEPHLALCGGEDGLDFYRHICRNFRDALTDDGCICYEFGMGQEKAVKAILKEFLFEDILFCRDTSNIIRAVIARKNGKEQGYGKEEN